MASYHAGFTVLDVEVLTDPIEVAGLVPRRVRRDSEVWRFSMRWAQAGTCGHNNCIPSHVSDTREIPRWIGVLTTSHFVAQLRTRRNS